MGAAGAALALQGIGQVASLDEQRKARKDAKKAREEDKRREGVANLINTLQGGQARVSPTAPLPQVGVGAALTGLGSGVGQLGQQQAASDRQQQLIQEQASRDLLNRASRERQAELDRQNRLRIASEKPSGGSNRKQTIQDLSAVLGLEG